MVHCRPSDILSSTRGRFVPNVKAKVDSALRTAHPFGLSKLHELRNVLIAVLWISEHRLDDALVPPIRVQRAELKLTRDSDCEYCFTKGCGL